MREALFDEVFGRLIDEIEARAQAELAGALAPVGNAPKALVRRLAHSDDIAVAGPILQTSRRLAEDETMVFMIVTPETVDADSPRGALLRRELERSSSSREVSLTHRVFVAVSYSQVGVPVCMIR